ncbi:MAG: PH domain-containing protein [Treponema sp.]|nr:PH domain-containing protein [Treponema sp.]
MKFIKKKNFQEGEFVIYGFQVHSAKVVSPLLLFGVISFFLFMEALCDLSFRLPVIFTLCLTISVIVYFLLEVLETTDLGYFIVNKKAIILVMLCPLLLMIFLYQTDPRFFNCIQKIIFNLKPILLTILILSAVHLVMQLAEYMSEGYYLTNKRLIIKKGFFFENITDIPIQKLESLAVFQGFWGSLFNYGTIRILGLGGSRPCMIKVRKPYVVRRKIDMVIEKNRRITVIQKDFPKPVVIEQPKKVIQPDIFDYGDVVTFFACQEKDKGQNNS